MLRMIAKHLGFESNSELAEHFGVSTSRIINWLNRETFNAEIVFTKCEKWINPAWLLSGKGNMVKEKVNQSSESDLIAILNKYPCICITDCEARVKYVNDNFERQTGYCLDDLNGKKIGDILQRKHLKSTEKKRIRMLLERGEPFYIEIVPNYTRTGEKVKCKINIIPLINNGKVTAYVSFADFVPHN